VIRVTAEYAQMNALLAYLTENCCAGVACGDSGRDLPAACSPTPKEPSP
jgi:hypothetical protein